MVTLFHTLISKPFYNGFIYLMDLLPFLDAGIVIILFTIIVKIIILPLSIKASKSQIEMKSAEKDLLQIREKYKDNKEQIGVKTLEYYREKGINPFVGIFILIIQLPILIGLYYVFLKSGLPNVNSDLLYSFVTFPSSVNMEFLGLIDIGTKNMILAFLAGLTTYMQITLASNTQKQISNVPESDIAKAMSTQMKYVFPLIMTFVAYTISASIALYFITSNVFAIAQEIYIRKKYHKAVTVV